jgi:hypothetical protein
MAKQHKITKAERKETKNDLTIANKKKKDAYMATKKVVEDAAKKDAEEEKKAPVVKKASQQKDRFRPIFSIVKLTPKERLEYEHGLANTGNVARDSLLDGRKGGNGPFAPLDMSRAQTRLPIQHVQRWLTDDGKMMCRHTYACGGKKECDCTYNEEINSFTLSKESVQLRDTSKLCIDDSILSLQSLKQEVTGYGGYLVML